MASNQENQSNGHGGKRVGAGRKGLVRSILRDTRFATARGIDPLYASEVLAHVISERRAWQRIFQSPDDRVVLDALKFLTLMRDGKPAQRIHVTSTSVSVSVDEINNARAIVAEILGHTSTAPMLTAVNTETVAQDDSENSERDIAPTRPDIAVNESTLTIVNASARPDEDASVDGLHDQAGQGEDGAKPASPPNALGGPGGKKDGDGM